MAAIFSLRNWVAKELMRKAEGIMKMPNKGQIDFGEMMIRENLFKRGIDHKSITNSKQLENILNTPIVEPKVVPKKSGEVIEVDFGGFPPEKKAAGGRTGLSYLLAEDTNQRVPFAGGLNAARRAFLKMMGAGAAGIGAAKTGLFGLLKGGGKKAVIKDLTSVPIGNPPGMPSWFKPLVNKVIKEGKAEKITEYDRLITHTAKLPESKTPISVSQDLNTGNVWVDIGEGKHGFVAGGS